MPNINSAKKQLRQSIAHRERNRAARSLVRNRIKNLIKILKEGNVAEAETQFRGICSSLDKAVCRNLWHANTAARKKSRLSHLILKVKQGQSENN